MKITTGIMRQLIVTLCVKAQNRPKLGVPGDDKSSVPGMHNRTDMKTRDNPEKPGHLMHNQNLENPEYDACRVDTIRDQLDEDKYFVDIQQIADKIIDIEMALQGNG